MEENNYCLNCGAPREEDSGFCNNCSQNFADIKPQKIIKKENPKEILYCLNCGAPMEDGTRFCFNCSQSFEDYKPIIKRETVIGFIIAIVINLIVFFTIYSVSRWSLIYIGFTQFFFIGPLILLLKAFAPQYIKGVLTGALIILFFTVVAIIHLANDLSNMGF